MNKHRFKGLAGNKGVTLIELVIYIAIVSVVMLAIYEAFRNQQNSYLVQEGVAIMQQNLRGGMFMITNDIQMAGYYTSYDPQEFPFPVDLDNADLDFNDLTGSDTIRPLVASNAGGNLVLIMADRDNFRAMAAGESAKPSAAPPAQIQMSVENDIGLNDTFFMVSQPITAGAPDTITVTLPGTDFKESYIYDAIDTSKSDFVARAQIIRYRLAGTNLVRETFGAAGRTSETMAEYVSGLTVGFFVEDEVVGEVWVGTNTSGTKPLPPTGDGKAYDERDIRRIQITLTGQITISPKLGTKTRRLVTTMKPRNMGMGTL
jgi:prepilin-type N-terminal cleavage/methylation domain-containing protein